jgi:hypothetical protein
MRLGLYASTPRAAGPNLVSLQDEALTFLPTVLVCPLKPAAAATDLRAEINWRDQRLIACTDLARPIRRTALRLIGHLDDAESRRVMGRFFLLLAR